MKDLLYRMIGQLALLLGIVGGLCLLTLILFFVGMDQNNSPLSSLGFINDGLNALAGILSAVLATMLHPVLHSSNSRTSTLLIAGTWAGAVAITYGSWLIMTDRSDVELSSYYYFFGNGLIGLWLGAFNRKAQLQGFLSKSISRWGRLAAMLMYLGLPALLGILMSWDGNMFSPLLLLTGISYLGTAILYPLWCLRLGHAILQSKGKGSVYEEQSVL